MVLERDIIKINVVLVSHLNKCIRMSLPAVFEKLFVDFSMLQGFHPGGLWNVQGPGIFRVVSIVRKGFAKF